jgi:SAM-dependent methyltransferase
MSGRDLEKAALRGEPSYIWREGQERRLRMIVEAAGERARGVVLDDGCGLGAYLQRLAQGSSRACGIEFDLERAVAAGRRLGQPLAGGAAVACARGEQMPFAASTFDLVLSHEVIEHITDDRAAVAEIVRVLKPGGRLALFVPNRGYPFETHGIYLRGRYRFGNIPLINYLPRRWRDNLAPHVRAYSTSDLSRLFAGLPIHRIRQGMIFGGYDNVIARWPRSGRLLRAALQFLERTPLRILGLSHFWVLEKDDASS